MTNSNLPNYVEWCEELNNIMMIQPSTRILDTLGMESNRHKYRNYEMLQMLKQLNTIGQYENLDLKMYLNRTYSAYLDECQSVVQAIVYRNSKQYHPNPVLETNLDACYMDLWKWYRDTTPKPTEDDYNAVLKLAIIFNWLTPQQWKKVSHHHDIKIKHVNGYVFDMYESGLHNQHQLRNKAGLNALFPTNIDTHLNQYKLHKHENSWELSLKKKYRPMPTRAVEHTHIEVTAGPSRYSDWRQMP